MNGNINDENVFSVTFQEKKKTINIKLLTGLSFISLRHLKSAVKNNKSTEFCKDRYAHSSAHSQATMCPQCFPHHVHQWLIWR